MGGWPWSKPEKKPYTLTDAFNLTLRRQKNILALVSKAQCPKCNRALRLIGYENSYDLSHYEYAITCDSCESRFIFTQSGLKGEYTRT